MIPLKDFLKRPQRSPHGSAPARLGYTVAWGFALAFGAPPAHAVYKCAGTGATPIYQEEPCPPGKELRNFDVDPPNLSVVPGRPAGSVMREYPAPSRSAKEPRDRTSKSDRREKVRGDATLRKHIRVGATEAEVIAQIGLPDVTTGGRQKRSKRYTWMPTEDDPDTVTTVTMVNGAVAEVDRKVVKR